MMLRDDNPTITLEQQSQLMREALRQAEKGFASGELPIGAIVACLRDNEFEIIGRGFNRNIELRRRIAHAEMEALNNASDALSAESQNVKEKELIPLDAGITILVTTLEPCIMCFSAAIVTGINNVMFGLNSPADGGINRVSSIDTTHSSKPVITGGILASESRQLFEKWLRNNNHTRPTAFVEHLMALTAGI